MEKCVLYMDILGFSEIVNQDIERAKRLLNNYQSSLSFLVTKDNMNQSNGKNSINKFDNFIPFSDSIFITSDFPEDLIKQISDFLINCFHISACHFLSSDKNPLEVTITKLLFDEINKKIISQPEKEIWDPLLFKVGCSFGEIELGKFASIINSKIEFSQNLLGSSVVKAVRLEQINEKGPNFFIDKNFYQKINDSQIKDFILKINDDLYEVLWPSYVFVFDNINDEDSFKSELFNVFIKYFHVIFNLWIFYNKDSKVSIHYLNFLKLFLKSTIQVGKHFNMESIARNFINDQFKLLDFDYSIDNFI